LREVIAVDEPLPPYAVVGIPYASGLKVFGMSDHAGKPYFMLHQVRGGIAVETREAVFTPGLHKVPGTTIDADVPVESGIIRIQGRELHCMRFRALSRKKGAAFGVGPISVRFGPSDSGRGVEEEPEIQVVGDRSGPAILVDLSREDRPEFLACMLVVKDEVGRVEDAVVVDFLKPFHVGPDR